MARFQSGTSQIAPTRAGLNVQGFLCLFKVVVIPRALPRMAGSRGRSGRASAPSAGHASPVEEPIVRTRWTAQQLSDASALRQATVRRPQKWKVQVKCPDTPAASPSAPVPVPVPSHEPEPEPEPPTPPGTPKPKVAGHRFEKEQEEQAAREAAQLCTPVRRLFSGVAESGSVSMIRSHKDLEAELDPDGSNVSSDDDDDRHPPHHAALLRDLSPPSSTAGSVTGRSNTSRPDSEISAIVGELKGTITELRLAAGTLRGERDMAVAAAAASNVSTMQQAAVMATQPPTAFWSPPHHHHPFYYHPGGGQPQQYFEPPSPEVQQQQQYSMPNHMTMVMSPPLQQQQPQQQLQQQQQPQQQEQQYYNSHQQPGYPAYGQPDPSSGGAAMGYIDGAGGEGSDRREGEAVGGEEGADGSSASSFPLWYTDDDADGANDSCDSVTTTANIASTAASSVATTTAATRTVRRKGSPTLDVKAHQRQQPPPQPPRRGGGGSSGSGSRSRRSMGGQRRQRRQQQHRMEDDLDQASPAATVGGEECASEVPAPSAVAPTDDLCKVFVPPVLPPPSSQATLALDNSHWLDLIGLFPRPEFITYGRRGSYLSTRAQVFIE